MIEGVKGTSIGVGMGGSQLRNEFKWRPTAQLKWHPYKVQIFYCLPKNKQKKVATYFLVFLIGLLLHLDLLYSQIFITTEH